jgi:hypothetical protein
VGRLSRDQPCLATDYTYYLAARNRKPRADPTKWALSLPIYSSESTLYGRWAAPGGPNFNCSGDHLNVTFRLSKVKKMRHVELSKIQMHQKSFEEITISKNPIFSRGFGDVWAVSTLVLEEQEAENLWGKAI